MFPAEITGKRTRCRMDGTKLIKVHLSPKEQHAVEARLDTFSSVYQKLCS